MPVDAGYENYSVVTAIKQCKVGSIQHDMRSFQVANGVLQIWRGAANTLNKQQITADKEWSSRLMIRGGV